MKLSNELKSAALAEFEAGGDWQRFVVEHGHAIREGEPYDQQRYHQLRGKLLHLVCTGDAAGQFPPNDDDGLPWDIDDEAESTPHDTHTAARYVAPTFPSTCPSLLNTPLASTWSRCGRRPCSTRRSRTDDTPPPIVGRGG